MCSLSVLHVLIILTFLPQCFQIYLLPHLTLYVSFEIFYFIFKAHEDQFVLPKYSWTILECCPGVWLVDLSGGNTKRKLSLLFPEANSYP